MKLIRFLLAISIIQLIIVTGKNTKKLFVHGERYSSIEELAISSKGIKMLLDIVIDDMIEEQETKLTQLKALKETLHQNHIPLKDQANTTRSENGASQTFTSTTTTQNHSNIDDSYNQILHPVKIFSELNFLVRSIEQLEELYNDNRAYGEKLVFLVEYLKYQAPDHKDLVGAGEALLRLQSFYELTFADLVNGKLHSTVSLHINQSNLSSYTSHSPTKLEQYIPKLSAEDCSVLGVIAYNKDIYDQAIVWLTYALELFGSRGSLQDCGNQTTCSLINDVVEYLAFSSYKLGFIEVALNLTESWLIRQPDSERALGNLEYYREELERQEEFDDENTEYLLDKEKEKQRIVQEQQKLYDEPDKSFDSDEYIWELDFRLRELCRKPSSSTNRNKQIGLKCSIREQYLDHMIEPKVKIEILADDPKILRLHDIITDDEVEHIKNYSLPSLDRARVGSRYGSGTSIYRIAKTSWLSGKEDPIVARLEKRISKALNLSLTHAEALQVANYGLGGFYGPHLDSYRQSKNELRSESYYLKSKSTVEDDRLATVLIYLNRVEIGGATVFPRLNLTVEPIEKSAVVWYNLLEDGLSDDRTLHTGCPILLGSKWIATFWPREKPNTYLRTCPLNEDEG